MGISRGMAVVLVAFLVSCHVAFLLQTVEGKVQQAQHQARSGPIPIPEEILPEDGVEDLEDFSLFQKGQVLGKFSGLADEFPKTKSQSFLQVSVSTAVDVLFGMVVCALLLHVAQNRGRRAGVAVAPNEETLGRKKNLDRENPGAGNLRRRNQTQEPVKEKAKEKTSPLHAAIALGDLTACEDLLQHGADINLQDAWLCTPLHIAAHRGSVEAARFLVQKGALVNVTEAWDQTPLHLAAAAGHFEICALLIEQEGCNKDAMDAQDRTALLLAGEKRHAKVCDFLLRQGAGLGKNFGEERVPSLLNNLMLQHMLEKATEPVGSPE